MQLNQPLFLIVYSTLLGVSNSQAIPPPRPDYINTTIPFDLLLIFSNFSTDHENRKTCKSELSKLADYDKIGSIEFDNYIQYSGKDQYQIGNYDKCLESGGYFYILYATYVHCGICVPIECNNLTEFQRLINKYHEFTIIGCNAESISAKAEKSYGFYITICIVMGLCILVVIASVKEREYNKYIYTEEVTKRGFDIDTIIRHFSIENSWRALREIEERKSPLFIFSILKVLSMIWIITGHTLVHSLLEGNYHPFKAKYSVPNSIWVFLFAGALFAVDIFIFISAFHATLALTTDHIHRLQQQPFKYFMFIYLTRILRILPLYLLSILLQIYILPNITQGPLNYLIIQDARQCTELWITNLLFINNFYADKCMVWTWYLALDIQLFICFAPYIFLLYYYPRIGIFLGKLLFVACYLLQIGILAHNNIWYCYRDPRFGREGYLKGPKYYQVPYTRLTPYLLGIIIAYMYISHNGQLTYKNPRIWKNMLEKMDNLVKFKYTTVAVIIISLLILLFSSYFYMYLGTTPKWLNIIYEVFGRDVFLICLIIFIYPLLFIEGSQQQYLLYYLIPIRKCIYILGRLTYGAYLTHMLVYYAILTYRSEVYHLSFIDFGKYTILIVILSYLVSFVLSLLIEAPIIMIQKSILKEGKLFKCIKLEEHSG